MQCEAKSKRSHEQCRKHALTGKRTCMFHGGRSTGRPIISGRYSRAVANLPAVLARYEEWRTDPNVTELKDEIALLRAKLEHFLEQSGGGVDAKTLGVIADFTDAISRLIERKHKIDHGERVTITVHDFQALATTMLDAARRTWGDRDGKWQQFTREVTALAERQGVAACA